ncbi:type I restriction enzyme HsdR N-terminal domain-containing protein [Variovorax paradoxus]|uniref:type I restriction enzyme HsdR N-terminal domain-containing protein n=1 Tax=Variovorax paradoxus TaxID=34073 RepID=UPI001931ABDE|nr:type I restriction enzyme HsdR N-terminal domain-containing protein [Variovorax paradoxus]
MGPKAPVFEAMNEADVREEVLAPLIWRLGYQTGTVHNVRRELELRYSRTQLGREKATDPPLRGKADYILEAGGKVRWVIEAKAPSEVLDELIEAQAWSYANHPDVRAVYFLVTNGRLFRLYVTNRGPDAPPALEFQFEELEARMQAILNTLAPASLLRDFPDVQIDEGEPLGPGLRSTARISSGRLRVERLEPPIAPVDRLTLFIVDGFVTRRPERGISLTYRSEVAVAKLQAMNEQIGLNFVELLSDEDVFSTDPAHPTTFRASKSVVVPKGTPSIDINTWQEGDAPVDMHFQMTYEAIGHLSGQELVGTFTSAMRMTLELPGLGERSIDFQNTGNFNLTLV